MKNYVIKKLTIDKLSSLASLCNYSNLEEMINENAIAIKNNSISIYGMYVKNELVGELRVKFKSDDSLEAIPRRRVYLYAFRISESIQSQGFGQILLSEVINELIQNGYTEFTVGVEDDNIRARYIYNKFGFNEIIKRKSESYQECTYEYNLYLKS